MEELEQLEAELAAAESALTPLDTALAKSQVALEKARVKVEEAKADVLAKSEPRDAARLDVMVLQDKVANLKSALGIGPVTQGIRR